MVTRRFLLHKLPMHSKKNNSLLQRYVAKLCVGCSNVLNTALVLCNCLRTLGLKLMECNNCWGVVCVFGKVLFVAVMCLCLCVVEILCCS